MPMGADHGDSAAAGATGAHADADARFGPGSAALVLGLVAWQLQDARQELAKLTDAGGTGVDPHREALTRLDHALNRDSQAITCLRRLLLHQAHQPPPDP